MHSDVPIRPEAPEVNSPSISLCCITAGPLPRVAAILSLYRPIVDEVICAVNARFTTGELDCLEGLVDRIIPVEMGADFLQERYRAWLYAQCSGTWILSTDSDEVPSAALLRSLPELAKARDVVTYLTTVCWCYPDVGHWLDEFPWHPSWKFVMARNDPATLYIRGGVHEGVFPSEPYRYLDLPIYHLDTAVTPLASRRQKVGLYDTLPGVQIAEDGRAVSEVYYLPELYARNDPRAVAEEDLRVLHTVLQAVSPGDRILDRTSSSESETVLNGTIAYSEVLTHWLEHAFADDAYKATIEIWGPGRTPRRDLDRFSPGEIRQIIVCVRNDGNEVFLRGGRNEVSLSSKWFVGKSPDLDRPSFQEGPRSQFTANVHPGDEFLQPLEVRAPAAPGTYTLLVDLVHEHIRWFGCGTTIVVEVIAE
jgi:hypothetical protein